jgi:hypothetical protein
MPESLSPGLSAAGASINPVPCLTPEGSALNSLRPPGKQDFFSSQKFKIRIQDV